mgnify:CR=1 FL=1
MTLASFSRVFNLALDKYLKGKIRGALRINNSQYLRDLLDQAHKVIMAGGKRLRPCLVTLGYRATEGEDEEKCLRVAIGYELFHFFALVHDDIIDHAKERHSVSTIHHLFGESQAILVGDILLPWALEQLELSSIKTLVRKMMDEVLIGQILDVRLMEKKKDEITKEELLEVMRLKTASYSFIRPLQIGAKLSRRSLEFEKFAQEFGEALGIAFQLQDDWLDKEEDKREGKPTFFTCGFDTDGLKMMNEHFVLAEKKLESFERRTNLKKDFLDLVRFIRERRK